MRALVVGSDGVIGGALWVHLSDVGYDTIGTTRRRSATRTKIFFDMAKSEVTDLPPADVVFICAGMASFADCRAAPEAAYDMNCFKPAKIAKAMTARGSRVVFLSTSAALDCKEPLMSAGRARSGVGHYGRSKAKGESQIEATGHGANIVRISKVMTPQERLLREWTEALQAGRKINAADDHRMSPISLLGCVEALTAIGAQGAGGIYQMSGSSDVSYYEAALHIAKRLGVGAELVSPRQASYFGIPSEEVLSFTSLESGRLSMLSGFTAPDPYEILGLALNQDEAPAGQ